MRPRQAIFPFLKLLLSDRSGFLKSLLKYTKEAYRKKQMQNSRIPSVDISTLVGEINETVTHYTYLDGTSRTIDIAFIKAVCRSYKNCNYLEIGSWRGESLVNISEVAQKCTSISLSGEEMLVMGFSEREASLQQLFSRGIQNVNHIGSNSRTFNFEQLEEKFDVVFIDGDHSYEGVFSDTKNAFKLLRDDKSIIIWHDCGFGLEDHRYESLSAIFSACPAHAQNKIYRVTNTMCGIYTNQEIDSFIPKKPQLPNKTFSVSIKSESYNSGIE